MKEVDPGHIYDLDQLGSDALIRITFPKRSGGAIQYPEEWSGPPNQEFFRALIKRTQYLNDIIACVESQDTIYHLRMALWNFEARAYHRKQEGFNRKKPEHDDSTRVKPWGIHRMAEDVPFGLSNLIRNEDGSEVLCWIEDLPTDQDRHISKDIIERIISSCE